jgi:hypothetical protein
MPAGKSFRAKFFLTFHVKGGAELRKFLRAECQETARVSLALRCAVRLDEQSSRWMGSVHDGIQDKQSAPISSAGDQGGRQAAQGIAKDDPKQQAQSWIASCEEGWRG